MFGRIVTAADVDQAVTDTLKTWLGYYLDEVARQAGADPITHPRTWAARQGDVTTWPEDRFPAVIVVTQNLALTDGAQEATGATTTSVVVYVNAKGDQAARRLAMRYIAAVRVCLTHKQSLDGFADSTQAVDETYTVVGADDTRTLSGAQVDVQIAVAGGVNTRYGGPSGPPPYPQSGPVVLEHEETVTPTQEVSGG